MPKCSSCHIEDQDHKGWYAELTAEGKLMRCPACGQKEEETRWKNRYGDKPMQNTDKQNNIQHAKDLRNANLSPWSYTNL